MRTLIYILTGRLYHYQLRVITQDEKQLLVTLVLSKKNNILRAKEILEKEFWYSLKAVMIVCYIGWLKTKNFKKIG